MFTMVMLLIIALFLVVTLWMVTICVIFIYWMFVLFVAFTMRMFAIFMFVFWWVIIKLDCRRNLVSVSIFFIYLFWYWRNFLISAFCESPYCLNLRIDEFWVSLRRCTSVDLFFAHITVVYSLNNGLSLEDLGLLGLNNDALIFFCVVVDDLGHDDPV